MPRRPGDGTLEGFIRETTRSPEPARPERCPEAGPAVTWNVFGSRFTRHLGESADENGRPSARAPQGSRTLSARAGWRDWRWGRNSMPTDTHLMKLGNFTFAISTAAYGELARTARVSLGAAGVRVGRAPAVFGSSSGRETTRSTELRGTIYCALVSGGTAASARSTRCARRQVAASIPAD